MAAELRVQQLLDEIYDSGRTPEDVCGTCPELLPEVRRRWSDNGLAYGADPRLSTGLSVAAELIAGPLWA